MGTYECVCARVCVVSAPGAALAGSSNKYSWTGSCQHQLYGPGFLSMKGGQKAKAVLPVA
eukprot:1161288-Pelagomonas_calceolata.AAC.5